MAAICIEDNVYPKRCSFYAGVRRELIPVDEHCGKIKAAKAAQLSPDFVVIARTEALIAGWGQEEALKRAEAYAEAGASGFFAVGLRNPELIERLCELSRRAVGGGLRSATARVPGSMCATATTVRCGSASRCRHGEVAGVAAGSRPVGCPPCCSRP